MENFFIEDSFYYGIEDFISDYFDEDEDKIMELPEDWTIEIWLSDLEQVYTLSQDKLADILHDVFIERFPEDEDHRDKIIKAFDQCVDFEKLNSMIPAMFYPSGKKDIITKKNLLDAL